MQVGWKKDLKTVAECCENIVHIDVFVRFHFFVKSLIFFNLGSLWGVILGGFGDLWAPFCGFLEDFCVDLGWMFFDFGGFGMIWRDFH